MMTLWILFIAWILSQFDFDDLMIKAIEELFGKQITAATYYFIALIMGIVCDIVIYFDNAY